MPSPEIDLTFTVNVPSQSDEENLMKRVMRLIAARYRKFVYDRFDRFSRGEGDWKPLSPVTIKRRRKGIKVSPTNAEQVAIQSQFQGAKILVDTGMLKDNINPSMSSGMTETYSATSNSAEVTIAFAGKLHPTKNKTGGEMTLAKLAAIHHFGSPQRHIPARPILVPPDEKTRKQIEMLIQQEIEDEVNE